MSKYDDIINLEYKKSIRHQRMSAMNRAIQFAPFAALNGHSDAINETGRLTDEYIELDENQKQEIDMVLQIISEKILNKPMVTVTYFSKDNKKSGGSYNVIKERVKKIDEIEQKLVFVNSDSLYFDNILKISLEN